MTGADLKAKRLALDWTQRQMAWACGLSLRQYQAIERSETPLRRLHELAIRQAVSDATVTPAPERD